MKLLLSKIVKINAFKAVYLTSLSIRKNSVFEIDMHQIIT